MTTATADPHGSGHEEEHRFVIRGRVQGVGFRWWTRTEASRLGITGSVRNRGDGSVEVLARGRTEALERFAETLHRGPPAAHVERVDREQVTGVPRESFEIAH